MSVRPAPGVSARVFRDGTIGFTSHTTAYVTYGPAHAAMWIALSRCEGDVDAAAETLAEPWESDPDEVRIELVLWISELADRGLVVLG